MIDRDKFFSTVRDHFGPLSQDQVDGFNKILDEWEGRPGLSDIRWLAYMLATVWHETDKKMQPIQEMGSLEYLKKKPYYPWIGRGLVQITWKKNYDKFGISKPEDALTWPVALRVMFDGMVTGEFTGKSLMDYFNHRANDPLRARRIINGLDRAATVKSYYLAFLEALGRGST